MLNQIQLIQFIALFSVNQLSIYGAVAAICDEYEGQPDNTGEPVILEGQSIVLREVKAEAPAREEPEDSNILCRNIFNKSNNFHQKTDWVNSVRKQDL